MNFEWFVCVQRCLAPLFGVKYVLVLKLGWEGWVVVGFWCVTFILFEFVFLFLAVGLRRGARGPLKGYYALVCKLFIIFRALHVLEDSKQ